MLVYKLIERMHFGKPYAGKPHVRFCGGRQLATAVFTHHYKKKGLNKLINLICHGKVQRLVLTHKDRLLRFGSALLFKLCDFFGTEVIALEEKNNKSFEQELVADVIEIMTVFTAKMHGKRSHRNKQVCVN